MTATVNTQNQENKKVKISMTSWRTEDIEMWNKVNAKFMEKYPNIEVVYNPVKNTEYDGYLMTALKSGKGEDVIQSRNDENGALVYDAGYLLPLDESMLPNMKDHPKAYRDHFIGSDGKYFAVPKEIDEAACIDGCGPVRLVLGVIFPLIKPALLTVITYNFMTIWNDVYFPLIFIHEESSKTLALGVTLFFGQYSTDWNLTFSVLTVAALPTLIIYLCFSKSLLKGITAGAVKG